MYRPVAAADAYGKHVTCSHDETLRTALFRATFLTFTVNFHPLDWEKIQKKNAIMLDHEGLFKEAQSARIFDEYIDLCLVEIESAFDDLDFTQSLQRLTELDLLVRRFKTLRDPARTALVDFLKEAGLSVRDGESLEELRQRTALLRTQHRDQRFHIFALEHATRDGQLTPSLQEAWSAFAKRIDRPAFWPSEENALELADAIKIFIKFILGKLRHRDDDPATVDTLVQRLEEWTLTQLRAGLDVEDSDRNESIQAILRLAQEMTDFSPDRRILQLIGESESVLRLPPIMAGVLDRPRLFKVERLRTQNLGESKSEATELVREIRDALRQEMNQEPPCKEVDQRRLRDSCLGKNWIEARSLAASLLLDKRDQVTQDHLSDLETVYAIALAHSFEQIENDAFGRTLQYACLATVAVEGSGIPYYLGKALLDQFVASAIVAMIKSMAGRNRSAVSFELLPAPGRQLMANL